MARFLRDSLPVNVVKSRTVNLLVRRLRENRPTAIVGMLVLALAVLILRNLLSSPADARLVAIRQKGYPTTLAELNNWYPAVIDSQNNARIYEQVFALPRFAHSADINWPDVGRALSIQDKKQLAELVATNQVALALLHSANASNRCRYSMDLNKLFATPIVPHFSIIQGEKLLCAEALLQASNGDSRQAVLSFRAGGVLADSVAEEPLFIGQIVRVACWTIMMRHLENVMGSTRMTEEELASLQAMVAKAEQPQALLRGLAGERVVGIALFADPVRTLADSRLPYNTTKCLKDDLTIGFSKSTGIFARDRTFYLDTLETSINAASLPFPERLSLGLRVPAGGGPAPRFCSISSMVLPRISNVFVSEANMAARLRCAQVALAVERFRRQHDGKLPAGLEELVPGYCKALPVDPFDGKQLRFKVLDSGYAIYSSGTDNGSPVGFRVLRQGDSSQP